MAASIRSFRGARRGGSRLATPLAAVVALAVAVATLGAAQWTEDPEIIGDLYLYTFFRSGPGTMGMDDGPDGVGYMGRPSFAGAVLGPDRIAVCDMAGGGSAVRVITPGYISTLAGSHSSVGTADGQGSDARFGGFNSGTTRANGLTYIDGLLYLADTTNNAIRVINSTGYVSTPIPPTATFAGLRINEPVYVASFADSSVNLFISDRGNRRILSAVLADPTNPTLALLRSGFSPGPLVYSTVESSLYYTMGGNPMRLGGTLSGTVETGWFVGNADELGYINSLMLTADQTELLYFGNGPTGVEGVYGIAVNTSAAEAPNLSPVMKFPWNRTTLGAITVLLPHSDTSYYVLTDNNAYVASIGPLPPQPSSSGGSGDSRSGSESHRSGSSDSSDQGPFPGRQHGIAAFPTGAFPDNNSCLMSELYQCMRDDAAIAYNTMDYYTQFAPVTNLSMAILGDVNVSTWCDRLSTRRSNDGTITILDFWGPTGLDLFYTQQALATSPWTNTRRFLDSLAVQGWELDPFCFYNCTDRCQEATADPHMCVGYVGESSCDDVCKGAIAASVVMGTAGLVLLILMVVSPANLFTALIMVPLI